MSERPLVSVVIPCRNERRYIGPCLDALLAMDYPHDRLEILVVDGMSDDGTREVLADYRARHPIIRVLDNPGRVTPNALNIGVAGSRGEIIMPIGAHNASPPHYITRLVHCLEESGADNVGGILTTEPGGPGAVARAIAIAMAHPFGVGNAHFRIGTREPRWVDTVPFGCYRREVFDRIGLFDEDLIRNQDDELNIRLIRAGGRILLVPDVVSSYHARDSLAKLWRMYYQYGYFKPLVARKVGGVFTWRQLVPPAFVLALIISSVAAIVLPGTAPLPAIIVGAYLAGVVAIALPVALGHGVGVALALSAAIPVLHVSYGTGFLKGVVDFLILRRKSVRGAPTAVPTSR
jgi:cellulose synthase/poly-beta-1,6-N-acetylglucosamine synthase-like glycosyltransferase